MYLEDMTKEQLVDEVLYLQDQVKQYEDLNEYQGENSPADSMLRVVSLVLGILGIIFALFVPVVGIVLAIVGLVTAIISIRQATIDGRKPGAASGGLTTSIIALVLGILMIIIPIAYQGIEQRANQTQSEQVQ